MFIVKMLFLCFMVNELSKFKYLIKNVIFKKFKIVFKNVMLLIR